MRFLTLLLLLAAAPLVAAEPPVQQSVSSSRTPAPPAGHPAAPTETHAKPPEQKPVAVSGKVLQTIKSGGYAYVLVREKGGKKTWVAIPEMTVTVGETVSFEPGMEMKNFPSTTLKRTFDRIIFSNGPVSPGKKKGKGDPLAGKGTRGSAGAVVAVADEKVKVKRATAPNAYTVAEIFKNRAKLNGKKVVIRAKVVKVSSGIMNRNWIHIQDGSGAHTSGDNDLVVTSDAIPAVGDTVIVRGTVVKDKDFGSNYKYAVIVEKAEIEIQ